MLYWTTGVNLGAARVEFCCGGGTVMDILVSDMCSIAREKNPGEDPDHTKKKNLSLSPDMSVCVVMYTEQR